MFDPTDSARVFALPLGVDFSRCLVNGLLTRLKGKPPEALARVVIYVNTRRSARVIEAIFCESGARLLPDIRVITDLAQDFSNDMPTAIPPLRRQLILARLVAAYLDRQPDVAPKSAVFDLAASLGALLDSFHGEGIAIDVLNGVDVGQQSAHWERSLRFLEILTDYWMHQRPESAPDPEERQRKVAQGYARLWEISPPNHPVIVAGSTGSRGSTAVFMAAVAALPQGAVVLPGYDYDMPSSAWDAVTEDHPQFGFAALRARLGYGETPPLWAKCASPAIERNRFISLALRPAPVTDQWLREGPEMADVLDTATQAITLVEAASPRAEAEAIAIRLRMAVQSGQKAALVSPDRMLTRRVSAMLMRWGVTPDDSAGRPLPLTPPGIFLREVAALAGNPLTPAKLLSLLKHPLCGGAIGRAEHLRMTRVLEMRVLRGSAPFVDWDTLAAWANTDNERSWISWMRGCFAPMSGPLGARLTGDWAALHREAAQRLSAGMADEPAGLWDKNAGKCARAVLDNVQAESAFGDHIDAAQYRALLQSELGKQEVRDEAFLPHPGVAILGTLEARVQTAELVILGDLNEGIWPSAPQPDPWMSRDMLRQCGLALPERRTGLSAHDFQQAAAAPEVVLTRAIRDGDSATVASRWVIRMTNLLEGLDENGVEALRDMRARGDHLLAIATAFNKPAQPVPPAPRPSPAPPVNARPDSLSVTRIEALIRDPYAIYADKILRLRRLRPIGREADALERGTALHKVLEVFLHKTETGLPDDAINLFIETAREVLAKDVPWPSTRRFWLARLQKVAPWFIGGEKERRARATPLKTEVWGERKISEPAFTLTAKADRIDLLPGGRVAIYDYKSGGLAGKQEVREFAVQLPLEGAIARAGGFDGIAKVEVAHLELIGLGGGGKTLALDIDDAGLDEVWKNLRSLLESYALPTSGYTARLRPKWINFASDYDHLSRYGEWQDGDGFTTESVG